MSSSSKTPNLNLHKWARTDPVLCDDFNENFGIIDNAIAGVNSSIGGLASTYGECQVYSGNYTGTGEQLFTLHFANAPYIIFLQNGTRPQIYTGMIHDGSFITGEEYTVQISVSGGDVSFFCNSKNYIGINELDSVYTYVAFGSVKG